MQTTKKAVINGYTIAEEVTYWGTKLFSKCVKIDGKNINMTYTQACNWAKKTDKEDSDASR